MKLSRILEYKLFNNIITLLFNFTFLLIRTFIIKNKNGEIVVVNLHKLGDAVFTIPALKRIINHHKSKITLVCFKETTGIFKQVLKDVNYIELSHSDFYLSDRIAKGRTRRLLKKANPKIIYDLTGFITSAFLIFTSKSKKIEGINEALYKKIYTKFSPIRNEPHITDMYLDAVRHLPENKISFKNDIMVNKNSSILIHPFAGWKSKEWNYYKFIQLAEKLNEKYNTIFILPKTRINEIIKHELKVKKIKFIETSTIDAVIEIITSSFLYIGNDSGPTYIANLLGIPTFAIYGPTNHEYHTPKNGLNAYITQKIHCSPKNNEKICFTDGGRSGCPVYECMNLLSVEEVEESVNNFIRKIINNN